MKLHIKEIAQYIFPFIIIIISVFIGILFQKIALSRLIKLTGRSKIKIDEILIKAFKGVIVFWFFILSLLVIIQITSLPEKAIILINKTVLSIFIFSITLLIANILAGLVQFYSDSINKKSFIPTTIFRNIAKLIIVIIGILVILQTLGVSITPVLTALGVGGLAVALALQDTLSNLFAGIQIIFSGQLKPGDFIKLESGQEGYVTDITWRNTTIKQLPENLIIIPNSKVASSLIVNYNLPQAYLNTIFEIGVSYSSDLDKVEKITLLAAEKIMKNVPGGVPNFKPQVRYYKFDDFSINLKVTMRAEDYMSRFTVEHEFIKELHRAYKKAGIEIPFPIRTVHLQKKK